MDSSEKLRNISNHSCSSSGFMGLSSTVRPSRSFQSVSYLLGYGDANECSPLMFIVWRATSKHFGRLLSLGFRFCEC